MILQKYSSIHLALLLLIFLYVGFVNAYNLFYVSPDGQLTKITNAEIYKPSQQFFEKVDVIPQEDMRWYVIRVAGLGGFV